MTLVLLIGRYAAGVFGNALRADLMRKVSTIFADLNAPDVQVFGTNRKQAAQNSTLKVIDGE